MLVLDREDAIDHWRRAEARIYPSVMVNAELYQQYIGVVRAVADELRDVRTEDDLVAAWHERGDVVREVVSRSAPPMLALMDLGAVRDAAFCHRHREITREQGKALAAERLRAGAAVRSRVGRPVRGRHAARLPPAGDARRQRARAARGVRAAARRAAARSSPWRSCTWIRPTARGCSTSRRRCRSRPSTPERNGRRASSRRASCSGGAEHGHAPQEDHRRALPHRRDPAVEVLRPRAPGQADGLRLHGHEGLPQEPHGRVQGRAGPGHVQLRRAGPRAVVRPQRRRDGRGDDQRPHPRGDLGVLPAAQRGDDAQGAEARVRDARRRAEDDVPARRQPRSGHVGRGDRWRSPTRSSTSARSTT